MRATITISAKDWDEQRVVEADAVRAIARATWSTVWSGDIEGESTCVLLLSYIGGNPDDPQTLVGPYAGYEQVTATLAGRRGTFVLAVSGEHSDGAARTDVSVVPGSATGELTGLRGTGTYTATAMEYTLSLDYDFE